MTGSIFGSTTGNYSYGSSSAPQPIPVPSREQGGGGPVSWLEGLGVNAFRDLLGIAQGIGETVYAPFHDVIASASALVTHKTPTLLTPELAKGLTHLPQSIAYDVTHPYEHPLQLVSDALMITGFAGGTASAAANVVGRQAGVAEGVAALKAGAAASDVSTAARFVNTIRGVGRQYIDLNTGMVQVGDPIHNPANRLLFQKGYDALRFQNPENKGFFGAKASAERAMDRAFFGEGKGSTSFSKATMANFAVGKALEMKLPITRSWYSNHLINTFIDATYGGVLGRARAIQDKVNAAVIEFAKSMPKEMKPEQMTHILQGLHTPLWDDGIQYVAPDGSAGSRWTQQFKDPKGQVFQNSDDEFVRQPDDWTLNRMQKAQPLADASALMPKLSDSFGPGAVTRGPEKSLEAWQTQATTREAQLGTRSFPVAAAKYDRDTARLLGFQIEQLKTGLNKAVRENDPALPQIKQTLDLAQHAYQQLTGSSTVLDEANLEFRVFAKHNLETDQTGAVVERGTGHLPNEPASPGTVNVVEPGKFAFGVEVANDSGKIGRMDVGIAPGTNRWLVHNVNVEPAQQGLGYGKQLYWKAAQEARARGGRLTSGIITSDQAKRVWNSLVKDRLAQKVELEFGDKKVQGWEMKDDQGHPVPVYDGRANPHLVDDFSRFRIVSPDIATVEGFKRNVTELEKVTGGKAVVQKYNIHTPDAGGERMARVVIRMADGHPVEFQLLPSKLSARTYDATVNLRHQVALANFRVLDARERLGGTVIPDVIMSKQYAAKAMSQHLWDGVTDELRHKHFGGEKPGKMRESMNNLRLTLHEQITDPNIGNGNLDVESAFTNTFTPMALRNGATYSAAMGDIVGGPSVADLNDMVAKAGGPAPVYVPMISNVQSAKEAAIVRPPTQFTSIRKDASLQHNSGFLLTHGVDAGGKIVDRINGELPKGAKPLNETDVVRLYALRAGRAARSLESLDMMEQIAGQFTRPIKTAADLHPGERIWSPTLLRNLYRAQRTLEDGVLEGLQTSSNMKEAILNALDRVVNANQATLQAGAERIPLMAVPDKVFERLTQLATDRFGNIGGKGLAAFRHLTNYWKALVLTGSPRWVLNNVFGNIIFLKLQGGKLSDVARQINLQASPESKLGRAITKIAKDPKFLRMHTKFLDNVKNSIGAYGLGGAEESAFFSESGGIARKGQAIRQTEGTMAQESDVAATRLSLAAEKAMERAQTGFIGKVRAAPYNYGQWVRKLNSSIEDSFRRAAYLKAAEKSAIREGTLSVFHQFWTSKDSMAAIFTQGLDPKNADRFVAETNKFLNDYRRMSPIGRDIIRPYVAPFWSFYRHAARTLVSLPFEHPLKARLAAQIADENQSRLSQAGLNGSVPSWLSSAIPLSSNAGVVRFLSTTGPNPFNTVLGDPAEMLNPVWKILTEHQMGRDSFTGKAYTAADVASGFGSEQQFKMERGPDGSVIPVPIEKVTPSIWQLLLDEIPQYTMVKDLTAGGSSYDTAGILDTINGRGVLKDPTTGGPLFPKGRLDTLAKFFGYNEFNFNAADWSTKQAEDQAAALKVYLRRTGELPPAGSAAGGVDYSQSAGGSLFG